MFNFKCQCTSLVAAVVPRTGKIIKSGLGVFIKEERICYKMVYFNLYLS